MPEEIRKSRSSFQRHWSSLIMIISIIVLVVMYYLFEFLPIKSLPYENIFFLILASAFYVLYCALFLCSIIVHIEEAKENNLPVLSLKIFQYLDCKLVLSLLVVLIAAYSCREKCCSFYDVWHILKVWILLTMIALLLACFNNVAFDYDDADISFSQNSEKSIGALWAVGSYTSYFKLTLEDMIEKIKKFEAENDVYIPVKKLFIICPLSCNVDGTFCKKDDKIFHKGQLEALECDQGANANRLYKHSVFGINNSQNEVTYIVAECASPLGTLWERRFSMNKEIWRYHRDCYIKCCKDLLKTYPCIVLEYDDQDSDKTEPLHKFLLSSIDKQLQDKKF